MNEFQWLTSGDVLAMLGELGDRISERKLRLFCVASIRRLQHLITDPNSRTALDVAERFAEGLATEDERQRAENEARYAGNDHSYFHVPVMQAVAHALALDIRNGRQPAPVVADQLELFDDVQIDEVADAAQQGGHREVVRSLTNMATREAAYGAISDDDEAVLTRQATSQEHAEQAQVLRELIGNPFRPIAIDPMWLHWNDGTVPRLARVLADEHRWGDLPILGDALEEAGCDRRALLEHLHGSGPHVPGCWALDLILGRH